MRGMLLLMRVVLTDKVMVTVKQKVKLLVRMVLMVMVKVMRGLKLLVRMVLTKVKRLYIKVMNEN